MGYSAFDDILEQPLDEQVKKLKKKVNKYIKECADLERELDLSNERNLRQSKEIEKCIDLIDRLRGKVSDSDWSEVCENNKKEFAEVELVAEEDGE
jgi:t-SNARE complex subunit (syntaxin)